MDKCYIYRRVSTEMQLEGYSLEAQEEKIRQQCKIWDLQIVGDYCDEGKSGKTVEGRDQFLKMCKDIKSGKDDIKFVICYKLSRLGRNNADILNFVNFLKSYDIYLKCTDEPIDTSNGAYSTLILSIMGAMVETERINILEQTMSGRQQKARNGLWNGGQAPYGYTLNKDTSILEICEEEANQVREIFRLFTQTQMGYISISDYFKKVEITKIIRGNSKKKYFTASTVKDILSNPVYIGKIAYGRSKTVKVRGSNDTKRVNSDDYILSDGKHEAIIDTKTFELAQKKIADKTKVLEKKHDLDHEYLISPLLVCPRCGKKMYGNCNKKKKNGKIYYNYFYMCDYSKKRHNHECSFSKQISAKKLEDAVSDVIFDCVNNSHSIKIMQNMLNSGSIDETLMERKSLLEAEYLNQKSKEKFFKEKISSIDYSSDIADSLFQQFQDQLNESYKKIKQLEEELAQINEKLKQQNSAKVSIQAMQEIAANWNNYWEKGNSKVKKAMIFQMIDKIEIYEQEDKDGKILKAITFKVPVYYKEEGEILKIQWDKQSDDETVVLLTKTTDKEV